MLRECWKDYPMAIICEKAIVPTYFNTPTITFYYCPADAPHYQVASIKKEHIEKHYGVGCELKSYTVNTITIEKLLGELNIKECELLSLDIEGIDSDIILDLDFSKIKSQFVSYEHLHLGYKKYDVEQYMEKNNYTYCGIGVDHNGFDSLYKNTN